MTFRARANDQGAKRLVTLPGVEFVRRFMGHVLPTGIKRIRHFGVMASACKGVKLAAARLALHMPPVSLRARECAQQFMARVARIDVLCCPSCQVGRLRVIAVQPGQARLPGPLRVPSAHSRGPP